jgi:predicted dehydrogenase
MRGVQIAALCDNDPAKARALARRFGVSDTFDDIDDLLDATAVDAVLITTPNHLHEPHALSVLRAGVNAIVERPFALSARGVERLLAAAEHVGRKILVANNHRFRSDVQALRAFLQGGELGEVHSVRAGAYRLQSQTSPWRLRRDAAGGGAFLELGLPLLDLAQWIAEYPQPVRLSATMRRARGANAVEDSMHVFVECEGGFTATIDVNWAYVGEEDRWWFEVLGTRGTARLAPLRIVKEINRRPVDVSPTGASQRESAFIQSYRAELAYFVALLRDEMPYRPPKDQILVYRAIEALYSAAESGRETRL